MIFYLTSGERTAPMRLYLKDWGHRMRRRVRILAYEALPPASSLPDATYVFADVDRIDAELTARAVALWEALAARGERVRLLNRPGVSMRRVELLRELHRRGLNRFAVHALDAPRESMRFPVFLRHALEHYGSYSELLEDAGALDAAIAQQVAEGRDPKTLLVVEFVDSGRPDGLYRKYASTVVGERVIGHHVIYDRSWQVKVPSLSEPWMLEEDRAYQLANPHEKEIRELFRLARIDYGRVDYGVVDGRIQVWEINTNPTLLYPPHRYTPEQLPAKRWFHDQFDAALIALDDRGPRGWLRWFRFPQRSS